MICPSCKKQVHEKCRGGTWCDCGCHPRQEEEPQEIHVLTWDWKEQLDLDDLAKLVNGKKVYLYPVETHSDMFALVIAPTPLNRGEVNLAFQRGWDE